MERFTILTSLPVPQLGLSFSASVKADFSPHLIRTTVASLLPA
jgi:hypothetical protein